MPDPSELLGPYTTRRTPKGPLGQEIEPFGVAAAAASAEAQSKAFKELINKVSWAIGSTYKKRYSGKGCEVTNYARMCAHAILRDHGYPASKQ